MTAQPTVEEALAIVQHALGQAEKIQKALGLNGHAPALTSGTYAVPSATFAVAQPVLAPNRIVKAAGRARQIAAMKRYWAKRRAAKAKAKR